MLRTRLFLTAFAFATMAAIASAATTPTIVTPESVTWKPVPGFAGFEMAAIVGDPSKAGEYYAYYLKVPAGGKAMPHRHAMTETVVVISGTFMVGLGDTMDMAKMKALAPGTVASIPAGVHHYGMAKGPVVVEISGIGPDTTTILHK